MDAILEKIPAIEECKQICEFLLDHYGLHKQFKELMAIKADAREKAELQKIFEHYGIVLWEEIVPSSLYEVIYHSDEHVDIICKYLATKDIEYDRELFIIKEAPKDEWIRHIPGTGPQFSTVVPQSTPR